MGLVSISVFNLGTCLVVLFYLLYLLFGSKNRLSLDNQRHALTLTILAGLFGIASQARNFFGVLAPAAPEDGPDPVLVPLYGALDLPTVILLALATYYLTRSEKREIAPLITSASLDPLTSLLNMGYFRRAAARKVEQSREYDVPLSLAVLDLDDFGAYNDAFGRESGDEALRLVAGILTRSMRADDLAARYGGEEFAVLLNCRQRDAEAILDRIRVSVETLSSSSDTGSRSRHRLTVSIGVSSVGGDTRTVEGLLKAADSALLRAKDDGKNRVIVLSRAA